MTEHSAAPTSSDETPQKTRRELEAEVELSRRELAASIDELTTRLSPSYQASQLAHATRVAARDTGTVLSGHGAELEERRVRNVKILLGVAAATAALVAVVVVRAARR